MKDHGWFHPGELKFLKNMASFVPEYGKIIEVGTWTGTSTKALAKGAKASVLIHCFDDYNQDFDGIKAFDAKKYFLNTVRVLHDNIILNNIHSPPEWWWNGMDLVFIDAKRSLYLNMDFWSGKLKENGTFIGHDFNKENEDVVTIVTKWAEENDKTLELYGSIWRLV